MNTELINISYQFEFENGTQKTFDVVIEPTTLEVVRQNSNEPAEWTKLENFECIHCPLDKNEVKHCPVAISLEELIEFFSDRTSFERVRVTVKTKERSYFKETDIQSAVGSLIGILMPSSGCPILAKLRPMLRFHLPFATIEETEFRVFATYSLAQFLRHKAGKEPDWKLESLAKLYEDIQKINSNVASKIASLEKQDASINSVIVLNNFAYNVTMNLDDDDFTHLNQLFDSWISD